MVTRAVRSCGSQALVMDQLSGPFRSLRDLMSLSGCGGVRLGGRSIGMASLQRSRLGRHARLGAQGPAGLIVRGPSRTAAGCAFECVFAAFGEGMPINVAKAMGAILAGKSPSLRLMNGVFMIARTPGLVAHVTEEQIRERPMRLIDPVNSAYDGATFDGPSGRGEGPVGPER